MTRKIFFLLVFALLQACSSSNDSPRGGGGQPATNPDGTPITGVITAVFDPASGDPSKLPIPTNLFFKGTTDLTLNIPVSDPSNYADPLVALNGLDGFSTVAPWSTNFSKEIKANTVNPNAVKLFKVRLSGPGGAVVAVESELTFGRDFVAVAKGSAVNIVPLRPLQEMTSYMAVLTNVITDQKGNAATPDSTYFLAKRTAALVDANGNSTDSLINNATARALEPLRQLVNSQEVAAATQGISRDKIVLSWVATTQSITPVMSAVKSISRPGATMFGASGLNTAAVGGAGIADIYIGTIKIPYYLGTPSAANPTAALSGRWQAAPGAYVAPFSGFGLDPTSTHVTVANPIPVATSEQNIPVLLTVPNAGSGVTKPAAGWPVLVFQHGITRSRLDMLALADTMASVGYAVVAIDLPLHGVTDTNSPLYVGNTPFAAVSGERTFDMDLDGDGAIDPSAKYYINLSNLLVSRDNLRQGVADLFTLVKSIPFIDLDSDQSPDLNGAKIAFGGLSLGSISGSTFLAMDPDVNSGFLSAPGGGIAGFLIASPTFGPAIIAGLESSGIVQGTTKFNLFVLATQTAVDSADPINFAQLTALNNNILLHEILGEDVIPNSVANAPLSGTEPLIANMGLTQYSESAANHNGLDAVVKFSQGGHGSLLSPVDSPAVTVEMQRELAAWVVSQGTTLNISDTSVVE